MAVISGLDMAIGASIATAHAFRMEIADELVEYIASGGSSGVGRKCGVNEWRGVAMAYSGQAPVNPGSNFTFTGSLDGTYGFTGTAYCEAVEYVWNIEEGRYLGYTVQFSRQGALTIGAAVATDSTKPNPPCTESLPLKFNGSEVSDVSFMRLKVMCPGFAYVSSSTSGGRLRKRGAMDAEFEYHCYYQDPGTLPVRGNDYSVQPYITDSTYWQVNWMKPQIIAPYSNPESRRPVNARVIMRFNGSNGTDLGSITAPDSSTVWPFA